LSAGPPSSRKSHLFTEGQVVAHKYRLVRQIDEGGMGQVWIAENIDLAAHVAVKLLRSGHRADAAERLKREARVLALIDHPAIVRVLDSGRTIHDTPFLVTELLHGETLGDLLWQNRRLGLERAIQTLLPILEGLSVVHERGVVHRDLKPANIFLARLSNGRWQPKVLDFGIAAVREGIDTRTTADGVLLGSPVYMSPEQARGLDVDARTDIWALCVLLYEMITGTPPFEGKNHHAVLQAVVEGEPKSLAEHGIEDLALWAILKRGLAKRPENRWSDARELGALLADWLVARGVTEDVTCSSLQATWLTPTSSATISSFPPVVLGTGLRVSHEAETLVGDLAPTPAPETRPTTPMTGRFWEVSVRRPRRAPPSVLLWLATGVLVGAVGTLLYASATMPAAPSTGAETAPLVAPTTAGPLQPALPTEPAPPTASAQPSASASAASAPRTGSTASSPR